MVLWFIYFLLSLIFMILCYITNPLVVPFCDLNGELPSLLKYWQTWDNSIYCRESVEYAPKILQYEWARHYKEVEDSDAYLRSVNRKRWYCVCIDPNFTLWERVQRYFCAALWLTRNCSYGFAFYVLGLNISPLIAVNKSENTLYAKEVYGQGLSGAWMYVNTAPILSIGHYTIYWNNLLGWKIALGQAVDTRAMIANRIAFKVKREG